MKVSAGSYLNGGLESKQLSYSNNIFSSSVSYGTSKELNVVLNVPSAYTLSYQWYKKLGSASAETITSATSNSYSTLSTIGVGTNYIYYCVSTLTRTVNEKTQTLTQQSNSAIITIIKAQVTISAKTSYTTLTKVYEGTTACDTANITNAYYDVTSTGASASVSVTSATYNSANVADANNKVTVVFALADTNNFEFLAHVIKCVSYDYLSLFKTA